VGFRNGRWLKGGRRGTGGPGILFGGSFPTIGGAGCSPQGGGLDKQPPAGGKKGGGGGGPDPLSGGRGAFSGAVIPPGGGGGIGIGGAPESFRGLGQFGLFRGSEPQKFGGGGAGGGGRLKRGRELPVEKKGGAGGGGAGGRKKLGGLAFHNPLRYSRANIFFRIGGGGRKNQQRKKRGGGGRTFIIRSGALISRAGGGDGGTGGQNNQSTKRNQKTKTGKTPTLTENSGKNGTNGGAIISGGRPGPRGTFNFWFTKPRQPRKKKKKPGGGGGPGVALFGKKKKKRAQKTRGRGSLFFKKPGWLMREKTWGSFSSKKPNGHFARLWLGNSGFSRGSILGFSGAKRGATPPWRPLKPFGPKKNGRLTGENGNQKNRKGGRGNGDFFGGKQKDGGRGGGDDKNPVGVFPVLRGGGLFLPSPKEKRRGAGRGNCEWSKAFFRGERKFRAPPGRRRKRGDGACGTRGGGSRPQGGGFGQNCFC